MKRKVKRLLSMLMVVVMLLGMLPTGIAFAQDGEYSDKATALKDTDVQATKTVSGPDDEGNYTITLNVKGDTTTSTEMQNVPADIVLVVDTSTSMHEDVGGKIICGGKVEKHSGGPFSSWKCIVCGRKYNESTDVCTRERDKERLDVAKEAAKNFVNNLMIDGSDVRIGLYDFSGSSRTDVGLTGVEEKDTLLREINNLHCPDSGDGTSYTEGLRGAQNILNGSTDGRAKFIVFISDGEPNNGNTGINIAKQLKQNGVTIFTVGVDINTNDGTKALKNISSTYKDADGQEQYRYYSGSSNALNAILEEIRKEIQSSIPAGRDAVMTDVINTDSFKYVDGSATGGLTVNSDNKTLTWNIDDITKDSKSVSFMIQLKDENTADGLLKTNSNVSLTFYSNKQNEKVTFTKDAIGDPTVAVYKVTYTDGVEGEEIFSDQTTYNLLNGDQTPDEPVVPTRDGYTFSGWSPERSSTVTQTMTYTAQWTPIPKYTVTYDLNGGTGTTPDSVTGYENTSVTVANDENFENPGYTFSGWNTEENGTGTDYAAGSQLNLARNVTLYAKWTPKGDISYTVKHYQQNLDGTYPEEPTDTDTWYGTTGTEVTATPKNYKGFTYNDSVAETVASGAISGDGTLVLRLFYSRNTHKVTYNLNGGTGATDGDYAEKTYLYGQEVTVQPAPTMVYRQFQGWQSDTSQNKVDPNSTFIMPDNDVNFTATWDAENYDVNVDKTSNANNPAKLGDKITYTVKVSNNGNMVMNDVTVTDTLWGADKVTAVSVSDKEGEQNVSAGHYTIETLNPKDQITITYTYTVTQVDVAAGQISNTVTATDGNSHEGLDTLETPVNPRYTITIKYVDGENKELQAAQIITKEKGETYSYDVSFASGATIPYALSGNYVFSHFTDESVLSGTLEKDVTITAVYTMGSVSITPAAITLYQGGDGYAGIVDGSGETAENTNSNGLPEPGYYIQLGADLNTALREALEEADDAIVDLSNYVTFTYEGPDGQTRTWTLEKYDKDGNSKVSDGRYIYRLVPAEGQDPVRLVITDPENGNKIVINDDFETDLLNGGSIYKEYSTSIYPGALEQNLVKLVIENTGSSLDGNEYPLEVNSGIMTVRGTTENSGTALIGQEGTAENGAAEGFTASVPSGTTYTVNGSQIGLNDSSGVALLVDDLLSEGVTGNDGEHQQLITDVIQEKSIQAIKAKNNDFETTDQTRYEMRYMNLVDTKNGDVYVTAKDQNGDNAAVTISWPMPKDADKNGKFYIVHFDGMAREYDSTVDLLSDIEEWDKIDVVEGKVNGDSISFTTDSFSPFILVWEEENNNTNPGGGGTTPNPPALNTEDHFSYVVGYEDGMVKPENAITRAEVASIFYRLLKDDVRDANTTDVSEFSDVRASDWYGTTVATLSAMDIVRGYEDGTFRPNAPITRAEFAAIATRFFEETGAEYEPGTFDDVTGDEWFANAIADAVELGLIGGYPDGTVRPNNNITRAEACAIVNRTLGRIPHVDHLLPADEMTTWPDNNPSDWFYADMQEATNGHEYEWTTEQGQKVEEWTEILDKDWEDR